MKPLIPFFDGTNLTLFFDFSIKIPGILLILGLIFGTLLAMHKARRDGLKPELILNLVPWLIVGIFVGGHLGDLLFFHPEILITDPWRIFKFWNGLFSYGGFFTCAVLSIWYFRREIRKAGNTDEPRNNPVDIWGYVDAVAYGLPVGWFPWRPAPVPGCDS